MRWKARQMGWDFFVDRRVDDTCLDGKETLKLLSLCDSCAGRLARYLRMYGK